MILKYKPLETDKISAFMNANKEKMKANIGTLLQNCKDKPVPKIKFRQNLLKKADSLNKNTMPFFTQNPVVKDLKNN